MKKFIFILMSLCLSGIVTFIAIEIGMRFLPVSASLYTQPVNAEQPIHKFAPNRTVTWSRDWNFSIVNEIHINNDGFINNQDYTQNSDKPLIAVVGDSYIEAVMVPYEETLHGRLQEHLDDDYRVYSFGASGAPLSQYLAFAKYARDTYKPERLIVVVVGNDFDESWPEYALPYTFHHFVEENGKIRPELIKNYKPSVWKNLIRSLATFRYLFLNMNMSQIWHNLKKGAWQKETAEEPKYVGNVEANTDERHLEKSKLAVDAFLELLPEYSGLEPDDIMIIVDAPRSILYTTKKYDTNGESYFEKMRKYLMDEGVSQNFNIIDMGPHFLEHYLKNEQRFEFPTDGHWSGYGHGTVFHAVIEQPMIKNLMKEETQ